jgi:hypothetical protein
MVINEELLVECKLRYPIGTVFISPYSREKVTIKNHDFTADFSGNIVCRSLKRNLHEHDCFIKYKNEWAPIISKPEITINSFEIW